MGRPVEPRPASTQRPYPPVETTEPKWTREEVQRVLYHVVRCYEQANSYAFTKVEGGKRTEEVTRRRFGIVGKRKPFLGGDSEFLRDAIRIARETLKDNDWWPSE